MIYIEKPFILHIINPVKLSYILVFSLIYKYEFVITVPKFDNKILFYTIYFKILIIISIN